MKKGIYDYWTGELIQECAIGRRGGRKLNEENYEAAAAERGFVIEQCNIPSDLTDEIASAVMVYIKGLSMVRLVRVGSSIIKSEMIRTADLRKPREEVHDGVEFGHVLSHAIDLCGDAIRGQKFVLVMYEDSFYLDQGKILARYLRHLGAMVFGVIIADGSDGSVERDLDEVFDSYTLLIDDGAADPVEESVSSRFAKYRALYEDASEDDQKGSDDDSDDDSSDEGNDEDGDSAEGSDEGKEGDDGKSEDDSDEDIDIKSVVITVPNGKGEDCKKQMTGESEVDGMTFSIPEDAIDVIEGEDGEDDIVKVDSEHILELKDYLSHKTMDGEKIDLEKILGIEIVDEEGDDSDESDGSDEGDEGTSAEDAQSEIDDFSFDDLAGQDWLGGGEDKE